MLRAEIPLKNDWHIPVWDEVLLGIQPNYGARSFDQNRIFAGVGRSLGKAGNVEVGYMNQFLGQHNRQIFEGNNTIFVTFTSNFDLSELWK